MCRVDNIAVGDATFGELMQRWYPLTFALNSLNRSLGMPDAYPFTLAAPVVEKLRFVHDVVRAETISESAGILPGDAESIPSPA